MWKSPIARPDRGEDDGRLARVPARDEPAQAVDVGLEIPAVAEDGGIDPRHRPDVVRQFAMPGHARAIDEHRNDAFFLFEGARQFETHPVVGPFDAVAVIGSGGSELGVADDHDNEVGPVDVMVDFLGKAVARRNAVHILEYVWLSEGLREVVEDAARCRRGVGAAIGNENPRHRPRVVCVVDGWEIPFASPHCRRARANFRRAVGDGRGMGNC